MAHLRTIGTTTDLKETKQSFAVPSKSLSDIKPNTAEEAVGLALLGLFETIMKGVSFDANRVTLKLCQQVALAYFNMSTETEATNIKIPGDLHRQLAELIIDRDTPPAWFSKETIARLPFEGIKVMFQYVMFGNQRIQAAPGFHRLFSIVFFPIFLLTEAALKLEPNFPKKLGIDLKTLVLVKKFASQDKFPLKEFDLELDKKLEDQFLDIKCLAAPLITLLKKYGLHRGCVTSIPLKQSILDACFDAYDTLGPHAKSSTTTTPSPDFRKETVSLPHPEQAEFLKGRKVTAVKLEEEKQDSGSKHLYEVTITSKHERLLNRVVNHWPEVVKNLRRLEKSGEGLRARLARRIPEEHNPKTIPVAPRMATIQLGTKR